MRNPFKYGIRVSGSSCFDRTKVKRAMLNTLDGGSNIVLFKRITPTVGIDNEGKPELKFSITSAKADVEALRDVLELPANLCTKDKRMVAESTIEHDTGAYRLANPLLSHHLAQQA